MPAPSSLAAPTALVSIVVFLSSGEETKKEKAFIHDLINKHINPELKDFQFVVHVFDSNNHTFTVPSGPMVNTYLDKLKSSHICFVLLGTSWVGLGTFQELETAVKKAKDEGENNFPTVVFKKKGKHSPIRNRFLSLFQSKNIPANKKHIDDVMAYCSDRLIWHNYELKNSESQDYYQSVLTNHTWKTVLRILRNRLTPGEKI